MSFKITTQSNVPPIIPADRLTIFQPGVTYNKIPLSITAPSNTVPSDYTQVGYGIPNRTTIFRTLTPSGGNDIAQVQPPHPPIPNSLYLTNRPAFFELHPWPWTDPSTGTAFVLPAKARFDAGTPNGLSV